MQDTFTCPNDRECYDEKAINSGFGIGNTIVLKPNRGS